MEKKAVKKQRAQEAAPEPALPAREVLTQKALLRQDFTPPDLTSLRPRNLSLTRRPGATAATRVPHLLTRVPPQRPTAATGQRGNPPSAAATPARPARPPPPRGLQPADSGTPREAPEAAPWHRRALPEPAGERRAVPPRPGPLGRRCPRAAPSGIPAAPVGLKGAGSKPPRTRPPACPPARPLTRSLRGRQGRQQLPHGGGGSRRPRPSR